MYPNHEPPTERLRKPAPPVSPVFHTAPKFTDRPKEEYAEQIAAYTTMAPQFHRDLNLRDATGNLVSIPGGTGPALTFNAMPSAFERALAIVKNVVVIVTCLVILYALWRLNVGIEAFKSAVADVANSFQDLGN